MKNKTVLITGAAGFIGSHLCDKFIAQDYKVIGMDNLITGNLANIEHLFKLANFEFYQHDVSKFVHVPDDLDYILHFASPASPIDYLKMPIQTMKVSEGRRQRRILTISVPTTMATLADTLKPKIATAK